MLKASLKIKIRFSEIDAMRVVWHGAYVKYLEDAREFFGKIFHLDYSLIEREGFYAPIVDMSIQYKQPLTYDMQPEVTIIYQPTEAAKLVFNYEIRNAATGELMATAHTIQVFMTHQHELQWTNPEFYERWKQENAAY
jgi:acyl-CoA thioester hydrolase